MTDPFTRLEELKRERDAIVLAHYYQDPDIQDAADFLGDSLALAKKAQSTDAKVIVLAGVHFMAETAKLLNPEKTVLVPDVLAGCSLSDSCPADRLARWKDAHSDHAVISYINCTAAVKALSDCIVTSSNAAKVVRAFHKQDDRRILFAPDRYLGGWLIQETGVHMDLWPGTCMVHETFVERELLAMKAENPTALFIAHPECAPEILRHAEVVGSTSKLIEAVADDPSRTFIVATEANILHEMQKVAPHATLIPAPARKGSCEACSKCPHMARNTIEKVVDALETLSPAIEFEPELAEAARRPVERMFELEAL